jgi:hypothetical protein
VHTKLGRNSVVDAGQKAAELDGAVSFGQIGDDLARGDVQGGVQVGDAWRTYSWGGPLRGAWQQREDRSGAVQRLHLGLSSTHSTRAAWGGFKYRPTMSRTQSMN